MNRAELQELAARADASASAEGAGADVRFEDLTPSEVQVGGSRVVLFVFRMVDGSLRELCNDYRPDREDLAAVIERDAAEMAKRLVGNWP